MATGREIKQVYDAMRTICEETSQLITVVNDRFVEEGFTAVGDGGAMWGRSSHYRAPRYWLPYFLQRVFTTEADKQKGVGITVTFDSSMDGLENKIPFVTCGLVEFSDGNVTKNNGLYVAGWTEAEGVETRVEEGLTVTSYTDGVTTTTYFLPLEILSSREKVDTYIVKPAALLYKGDVRAAYEMVRDAMISLEDITAESFLPT